MINNHLYWLAKGIDYKIFLEYTDNTPSICLEYAWRLLGGGVYKGTPGSHLATWATLSHLEGLGEQGICIKDMM